MYKNYVNSPPCYIAYLVSHLLGRSDQDGTLNKIFLISYIKIILTKYLFSLRSQWLCALRYWSAAARLLGLRVRNRFMFRECMCCQVQVSAKGRSLVQRSTTEFGLSNCSRSLDNEKA